MKSNFQELKAHYTDYIHIYADFVCLMLKDVLKHQTNKICINVPRRTNPCGSLASDGIELNMIWMEIVKLCNK